LEDKVINVEKVDSDFKNADNDNDLNQKDAKQENHNEVKEFEPEL
jgi:hypothetical protein